MSLEFATHLLLYVCPVLHEARWMYVSFCSWCKSDALTRMGGCESVASSVNHTTSMRQSCTQTACICVYTMLQCCHVIETNIRQRGIECSKAMMFPRHFTLSQIWVSGIDPTYSASAAYQLPAYATYVFWQGAQQTWRQTQDKLAARGLWFTAPCKSH